MIPCRFIYRFVSGGSSDSLNQVYQVHAVPCVGDAIDFVGEDGNAARLVVLEVAHSINPTAATHEVVVYCGDRK